MNVTVHPDKTSVGKEVPRAGGTIVLFLVVAALGAAACLWAAWCEFPFYHWNDLRLAPAFALREGVNPYPPLGGGPLTTWIYGPVGMLVNLPATLAPTVTTALQSAFFINSLLVIGPLALVFFSAPELRARGAVYPWLALCAAILFVPRPNLVLQVADHAAIGFGIVSSWLLIRANRPPDSRTLASAAVACALAVWSKQIAVFLVLAQAAYLYRAYGLRCTTRYILWVAAAGLLALAGFCAAFGFGNLWLNLVEIPGRLPWANIADRFMMRAPSVVAQCVLPVVGLLILWRTGAWPKRDDFSGRFFHLMVWCAAFMLPVGLAGFFKAGGDTNLLHSWDYLLPAAMLWLLLRTPASRQTLVLGGVVAGGLLLRHEDLQRIYPRPLTGHHAAAAELLRTSPGRVWFPQNPLINYYGDGRLWHAEDGVSTRHLAGFGLREVDFRRHLPPNMAAIAYPSANTHPFAMALLQDFNQVARVPFWNVYTRPAPAAPTPASR